MKNNFMNSKLYKIIGTKTPPLSEDTIHRAKVVARKRELNKIKDDNLNGNLILEVERQYLPTGFNGTHQSEFKKQTLKTARRIKLWNYIFWIGVVIIFIIGLSI